MPTSKIVTINPRPAKSQIGGVVHQQASVQRMLENREEQTMARMIEMKQAETRKEMSERLANATLESGEVLGWGNVECVIDSDVLNRMLRNELIPQGAFILVNLTGKEIVIKSEFDVLNIPPLDDGATKAEIEKRRFGETNLAASGIVIRAEEAVFINNLPKYRMGVYYVVSQDVAEAARLIRETVDDLLTLGETDEDGTALYLSSLAELNNVSVDATFAAYRGYLTF